MAVVHKGSIGQLGGCSGNGLYTRGLWCRARVMAQGLRDLNLSGARRLDRDKHCFATFLFTDIFKNSYNVSQIIAKVWNKGFSTVVSSCL